jgi:hypothetical protein
MTAPLWRATSSTGGWLVPEQVAPQVGGLWGVGGAANAAFRPRESRLSAVFLLASTGVL